MKLALLILISTGLWCQTMVLRNYTLDPSADSTVTSAVFMLPKSPAPGTVIFVLFRSSQVGGEVSTAILPGAINPRQLQVILPLYRPFTPADVLTVMYWTFDP